MAKTVEKFSCPCGYNTEWLYHALYHVDATGHTMAVTGTVEPGIKKNRCPPLPGMTPARTNTPASSLTQVDTARFDELRAKIFAGRR